MAQIWKADVSNKSVLHQRQFFWLPKLGNLNKQKHEKTTEHIIFKAKFFTNLLLKLTFS